MVGTLISDSWVVVLPARRPRRVVRGLGCAFLYLSLSISIYLYLSLCIYSSIYLSVCLSIYLSI